MQATGRLTYCSRTFDSSGVRRTCDQLLKTFNPYGIVTEGILLFEAGEDNAEVSKAYRFFSEAEGPVIAHFLGGFEKRAERDS